MSDSGTVLIVDDNPGNLGFLFTYLEQHECRVLVALSGDEALEQLALITPDLILLDVMMPGRDGFETCREIKRNPRSRDVPVIFMSALTDPRDKVKGFDAGAVDYITKPVNEAEVLARVSTQMSLQRLKRELQARNAELEQHSQTLSERNEALAAFGSMVAHDLRDALACIMGGAELLLGDPIDNRSQDEVFLLRGIRTSGDRMARIMESLILLARVSGQPIELAPLDMDTIVTNVTRELAGLITSRGAEIALPERAGPTRSATRRGSSGYGSTTSRTGSSTVAIPPG